MIAVFLNMAGMSDGLELASLNFDAPLIPASLRGQDGGRALLVSLILRRATRWHFERGGGKVGGVAMANSQLTRVACRSDCYQKMMSVGIIIAGIYD